MGHCVEHAAANICRSPSARSYVITNGGGQPNVVPGEASVWYYFREQTFDSIRKLYETGNTISEAAAMATGTTVTRRVLGYAAPNYGNKPMAEAAYANIKAVGMPKWSADDQAFAKAVQGLQRPEAPAAVRHDRAALHPGDTRPLQWRRLR